ncbi:MAG: globin domain-containing protein [Planctomycetaceae bacterium]|nr:globin domain-containing protein [Planctomycetaceae bacterium]
MVTPEDVSLVQSSWAKVAPISDTAADLFYGKLFELDPSLQELFPEDMTEQKKKLMQTLAVCVNGLSDLGEIVPAVKALGQRHVGYKVKDEHYETVGTALLWTLGQGLGDEFTAETEKAWTGVYTVLATTMKEAAAEVPV